MKIPTMETGRASSHNSLGTAALLENLGGCCEGTVFTFTSAGPKWRLRQRLNRNKGSLLHPHGVLPLRGEPAESVFTEMRIMPRSSEVIQSNRRELWDRTKWLTSTSTEDPSRVNNMACYDNTERSHRRIKKLTGQTGGDQRVKVFPQEAVKADNERKKLQLLKEETTPRKSRRYLRCDNFRERQKYGDLVEDDKSWTWNEKKLEEVCAQVSSREPSYIGDRPAEERRHKRESCADEIQIFEQRKVTCRRREQDLCTTPSDSMQSENLSKAGALKQASYEFNYRQAEEQKTKPGGHVATISTSVADESSKSRRGPSIEAAEEIKDEYLNYIPKQRPLREFQKKRGNITEENRPGTIPRPELESASIPPVACSFISFKAGVPGAGNRKCHPPGDATLSARPFSDVEYVAIANCEIDAAQPPIFGTKKLFQENNALTRSIPHNATEGIVGLSFQRTCSEMEGDYAHSKTRRAGKPETLDVMASTGRERERIVMSETGTAHSSPAIGQEEPHHKKPIDAPQESPRSRSVKVMEGSFDSDGDLVTSSGLRGPHKFRMERTHSGSSNPRRATVSDGESATHRVNVPQLHRPKVKQGPGDRVSSPDWYESDMEDDSDKTDPESNDQRANEGDRDDEFTSIRKTDGPSSVEGKVESRDEVSEGSLDGKCNPQLAQADNFEHPGAPKRHLDNGNGGFEGNLPSEIASNDLRKSSTLRLERQSFRDAETNFPDGKYPTGSSGPGTGIVDLDPLPQKSVPLRRQPWVKSFKRKTGENIGYFDYWLGRGKKDLSSRKPSRTSPGRTCCPKGGGELTQANQDLKLELNDEHDKSRPLASSIEQHLTPQASQAWSKRESQAYVTKEFEILETVLRSEVTTDYDDSEGVDCSQHQSITSSTLVGTVDRMEGRWQERSSMAAQSDSQVPASIGINFVATSTENDDNLLHARSSAGQNSRIECGEQLGGDNCQQLPLDNMSAKLHSFREQESSHVAGLSNNKLGEAKDCGSSFQKTCKTEEKLTSAHGVFAEVMKSSPLLSGLNGSRDKVLDGSDVALQERNMTHRFGDLATEISGHAEDTSVGRKERKQFHPSGVSPGSMNTLNPVDTLVQFENLEYGSAKTASSVFSQQILSPVQESNSTQVMVGYEGNAVCTDEHFPEVAAVPNGDGLTESETGSNIVDLECSSARFTSDIGFDQFPSSVKEPTEKETLEADKMKESPFNRRHKTPIIVRVRNRIANGWRLQHSLWRRVAKQKMKTGEAQVPATKGLNQKGRHVDPSSFRAEEGFTLDDLTGVHESWTDSAIDTNAASKQDTELTVTSMPQILEAQHRTCAATRNEQIHQGSLGDPDTTRCPLKEVDLRNEPSTPEKYEVIEQTQVNRKQAPTGNHGEAEEVNCPAEENSVLTFAQWQSRAKGFGYSSPYRNKVGANSIADLNDREREVTELAKSNAFSDVGGRLSIVCLGNSVKEATVLGTFGEFDAGSGIQIILGQGDGERDSSGFRQESHIDACGEMTPAVCPGKREKLSAVPPKSTDSRANEHISNSNSEITKSCYCQTEPLGEFEVPQKKETCVPVKSPGHVSLQNCCPCAGGGVESEASQESESLQKYLSLNDQNKDLHSCSYASLDHACEGSPYIAGRIHMPGHTGHSIDEPRHPDDQLDNMCFTSQVEDILDRISIEPTLDESAPPASFECQPCPETVEEEQHRSLPKFVEPFGQVRVVAPFCPPLQASNPCGNELVWDDGHLRRSGPQVRQMPEDPPNSRCFPPDGSPGDRKHLELFDVLKLPSNQQQPLPGHTLKDLRSEDNQEYVRRTGQQTNACESSYQTDNRTLCWKDVSCHQNANDLPTEEQVFLERFSATSNNLKTCKLPQRGLSAYCNSGFEYLGQSYCPHSPDLSNHRRLLSAPAVLNCGNAASLSFDRSVEPASQPPDTQFFNPLPARVSKRYALGEARRLTSSQEYKHDCHSTFKSRSLPDYAPSLGSPSPSSSINRSMEISEKDCSRAHLFTDYLNKYEHRGAWVQGSDGVPDWRSFASQECFPALTMQHSSFPAQCQSLHLNPRQSFCHSHTSQESIQCRCDPCKFSCRYSPSVLLNCHYPSCTNAVRHNTECHFPPVPVSFHEHGTTVTHGLDVQYPEKDALHPYCPSQVMQPSGTSRPWSHGDSQQPLLPPERHKFSDKNRETQNRQVGRQCKGNQATGTDRERVLLWLSQEEMNIIQQLRISRDKAIAVCRNDAAACIQKYWRKYLEKTTGLKLRNEQKATTSSLLPEYPMLHDSFQFSKLCQAATSLQLCGSSPKYQEFSHESFVQKRYKTMQEAARIIQRAWRSALRNRKEKVLTRMDRPKDLKKFYDIVKCRTVTRGRPAPSFELFAKSVERIQAATEGARVRRRLKSHRLQTIVMEIKEIRMLLFEMSQEANCDSTPFLFPQLCTQLRQKISQLHAALNGMQMEARFLLRRCPATPLKMQSSRSTSPKPIYMMPSQKSMNPAFAKVSSAAVGARKIYSPPLTNSASVVSNSRVTYNDLPATQPAFPAGKKLIHTQSFVPLTQTSKGNPSQLQNLSPDPSDSADPADSAKLLQWYFMAQRSPSKCVEKQGTLVDVNSRQEANVKGVTENSDPSQKKSDVEFFSKKASPKSNVDSVYRLSKSFDDQPLPVPQRRKIPETPLEEMVVGGSNASMYLTEYAPNTDFSDKPKRPFLKRKSIAMPSQKLDWSKVKPMVSSRLQPELKTKLFLCKVSTKEPIKEPTKSNSKKKKANYSNVKSRLFSYEDNVSPTNSEGTCLRSHTTEASVASYPLTLRSLARGPSMQETESSRNSRVLASRQRAASPDLMHLRRMAEADRQCPQTSMRERESVATYSSNFNSARYLHKLGNSEQTSNDTLIGERTQRIRLRILPRSKDTEVGDLFVQEEMQEIWEDQSLTSDAKGKRQQSHSHRYAIYQEEDARYSSMGGETTGPDCAKDDRKVTATFANKEIKDSYMSIYELRKQIKLFTRNNVHYDS